jgi:hypothetical protein
MHSLVILTFFGEKVNRLRRLVNASCFPVDLRQLGGGEMRYSFYVKLVMLVVALSVIAVFIAESPWGPD